MPAKTPAPPRLKPSKIGRLLYLVPPSLRKRRRAPPRATMSDSSLPAWVAEEIAFEAGLAQRMPVIQRISNTLQHVLGISGRGQPFDAPSPPPRAPPKPAPAFPSQLPGSPLGALKRRASHTENPGTIRHYGLCTPAGKLRQTNTWPEVVLDPEELLCPKSPRKKPSADRSPADPARARPLLSTFQVKLLELHDNSPEASPGKVNLSPTDESSDYALSHDESSGVDSASMECDSEGDQTPILLANRGRKRPLFDVHCDGGVGMEVKKRPDIASARRLPGSYAKAPVTLVQTAASQMNRRFSVLQQLQPEVQEKPAQWFVPHLAKVFEEWITFGRNFSERTLKGGAVKLRKPREIPITSLLATTSPSRVIVPEKVKQLYKVDANDVAELKMFEFEVLESGSPGPYHETEEVNANVWMVIFIREKPQRRKLDHPEIQGERSTKKRRTQAYGRQSAKASQQSQQQEYEHPWQTIAFPAAHITKSTQVMVPLKPDNSEERKKCASELYGSPPLSSPPSSSPPPMPELQPRQMPSRRPLAPKVSQLRRPAPQAGRTHLRDVKDYIEYQVRAQTRAEGCGGHEAPTNASYQSKVGMLSKQNTSSTYQAIPKRKPAQQRLPQHANPAIHPRNATTAIKKTVQKMERLTTLQFLRGGYVPLISSAGVDYGYWHDFLIHFARGELRLDITTPADGEPVVAPREPRDQNTWVGKLLNNVVATNYNGREEGMQHGGARAAAGTIGQLCLKEIASTSFPAQKRQQPLLGTNARPGLGAPSNLAQPFDRSNVRLPLRAPTLRGWQTEMLSSLAQDRDVAWAGWTERAAVQKKNPALLQESAVAEREFAAALTEDDGSDESDDDYDTDGYDK